MSASDDEKRIAEEERHWNTPRMMVLGFGFLAVCIAVILAMANLGNSNGYSLIPGW